MCGFLGLVYSDGRSATPEVLNDGLNMINHRGPDAWAIRCEGPAVFGHKRLAIIDLSPTGAQPMAIDDGDLLLTFNGEIYNYIELREELIALGHSFRGPSDSEVILRGYRQWGAQVVDHLRGMFAFGIWDRTKQTLFLARDRVGKKPLFYFKGRHFFAFASEIKSLLAIQGVPRRANLPAIADFLHFQYMGGTTSAFEEIQRLRPSHTLLLQQNQPESLRHYWNLSFKQQIIINEQEAIERLRAEIETAVELRLRADVEVGAFLSGGVDSTIMVGLAAKLKPNLRTFTVGFSEQTFDESPFALQVAQRYGTQHQAIRVTSEAKEVLPLITWHFGEPFADPSAVPSFFVAQFAGRHLKVVLNGDGGDESFVGYTRYSNTAKVEKLNRIPMLLRRGLAGLARNMGGNRSVAGWTARLQKLDFTASAWYREWMTGTGYVNQKALLSDAMFDHLNSSRALAEFCQIFDQAPANTSHERAMYTDYQNYLPDNLLVKMDVACMAFSLEGRSPFLDHRVMELAASLPLTLKTRPGCSKYLLKKAFEDIMPMSFYNRPKQGFSIPLSQWLRTELRELVADILLSETCRQRGLFQTNNLEKMIQSHNKGEADHGFYLWKLMQLELWFQMWIDGQLPERPAIPPLLR